MAGIRVNTGVKRIEVNDNGDFITMSLNDNDFLSRFFSLYENVQKMAEESSAREREIQEQYKGSDDRLGLAKASYDLYTKFGKDMMGEVDALFGEGTCSKVFGDITPTFDLYIEFFEQLTPYLQEFAQEKSQRTSKYSASRTGNV